MRLPNGEYIEPHLPVDVNTAYYLSSHDRQVPIEVGATTDVNGVDAPGARASKLRARASRFFFADGVPKPTREELEAAHSGNGHSAPSELGVVHDRTASGDDSQRAVAPGSGGNVHATRLPPPEA
jgi:ubiquinol-cytochrome c reductase cytochrome b subunit